MRQNREYTRLTTPANHRTLRHLLLPPPSVFPSIRVFSSESALRIRRPKCWSFSLSICSSSEYSGLSSFRMDWLDSLAVVAYFLMTAGKNRPCAPGLKSWGPRLSGPQTLHTPPRPRLLLRPLPSPGPSVTLPPAQVGVWVPAHLPCTVDVEPLQRCQQRGGGTLRPPGSRAAETMGLGQGSQRKGEAR